MIKSLLWKNQKKRNVIEPENFKIVNDDLKLRKLYSIMSLEPSIKMNGRIFLGALASSMEDIKYRQCILKDFMKKDDISSKMQELIVLLDKMAGLHKELRPDFVVPKLMLRLKKLEVFISIMKKLEDIFSVNEDMGHSDEFISISNEVRQLNIETGLEQLENDVSAVKAILNKYRSIDLGVNIDHQFDAREAIICVINDYSYKKSNVIDKILNSDATERSRLSVAPMIDLRNIGQIMKFRNEIYKEFESLLNSDIHKIEDLLEKHSGLVTSKVLSYRDEICLYFGGLRLNSYLKANGHSICLAEISESSLDIEDLYSISMVYEKNASSEEERFRVVKNNIVIEDTVSGCIITGANDGGKTVLLESLGTMHLLFQNGLALPARKARMPVYKKIYTHFPKDENISLGTGRLGEEAARISRILEGADKGTLVLFNEPYITTSPWEGLEILGMTLRKFNYTGTRIYLVTHYLDILEEIGEKVKTVSYVMETDQGNRTYRALKREPMSNSLALDVAKEHGVDEEGILDLINSVNTAMGGKI